jgi:hypothetical protein
MRMKRSGRLWVPEAPNLILGRGPCPRPTMEAEITIAGPRLMGIISYKLIDAKTGRVKREGSMRNLITDAGLNALGGAANVSALVNYCGVGTSGTAPANAQTDLLAPVAVTPRVNRAGTGNGTTSSGAAFAYWYYRRVVLFLETEGNGNLQEVGFFTAVSAGTMWARQLFKDGVGTPTVLTKTATDQLQITYEFRIYPPTVDVGGNVTISAVVYAYNTRAANINNNLVWGAGGTGALLNLGTWSTPWDVGDTNVLGTTSGQPAASSFVNPTSTTYAAYGAGTFFRDVTLVYDPGIANFAGGIGCMRMWPFSSAGAFQLAFTPTKLPKDATKRLTITFRSSWGRYP